MFDSFVSFWYSPFSIPIVAILAGIGIPVITSAWIGLEKHKEDCKLKKSMIERGMSATDIERVLAATTPPREDAKS